MQEARLRQPGVEHVDCRKDLLDRLVVGVLPPRLASTVDGVRQFSLDAVGQHVNLICQIFGA